MSPTRSLDSCSRRPREVDVPYIALVTVCIGSHGKKATVLPGETLPALPERSIRELLAARAIRQAMPVRAQEPARDSDEQNTTRGEDAPRSPATDIDAVAGRDSASDPVELTAASAIAQEPEQTKKPASRAKRK